MCIVLFDSRTIFPLVRHSHPKLINACPSQILCEPLNLRGHSLTTQPLRRFPIPPMTVAVIAHSKSPIGLAEAKFTTKA
jgi:hypothetical protein